MHRVVERRAPGSTPSRSRHADTLDLLGMEGEFTCPVERAHVMDVGHAFRDLLDGAIEAPHSNVAA